MHGTVLLTYSYGVVHQISGTNVERSAFLDNECFEFWCSLVEEGSPKENEFLLIWQVRDQACIIVTEVGRTYVRF